MGPDYEDPRPPDEFWETLPTSARSEIVSLLVEVAYEVISDKSVMPEEKGNDDDTKQGEG